MSGLARADAAKARLAGLVAEAEQALAPFGKRDAMLIDAARFVLRARGCFSLECAVR